MDSVDDVCGSFGEVGEVDVGWEVRDCWVVVVWGGRHLVSSSIYDETDVMSCWIGSTLWRKL